MHNQQVSAKTHYLWARTFHAGKPHNLCLRPRLSQRLMLCQSSVSQQAACSVEGSLPATNNDTEFSNPVCTYDSLNFEMTRAVRFLQSQEEAEQVALALKTYCCWLVVVLVPFNLPFTPLWVIDTQIPLLERCCLQIASIVHSRVRQTAETGKTRLRQVSCCSPANGDACCLSKQKHRCCSCG